MTSVDRREQVDGRLHTNHAVTETELTSEVGDLNVAQLHERRVVLWREQFHLESEKNMKYL